MNKHPFAPQISKISKKLLIGTLPPEEVYFYFSNSSNTRLWDILKAIKEGNSLIGSGANQLSRGEKIDILDNLELGISDIILGYDRDFYNSTKDKDIIPVTYQDILSLIQGTGITHLLFVYHSALKWFMHSLEQKQPVKLNKLRNKYSVGSQMDLNVNGKIIKCTLLPSPLNRGRKGENLAYKLSIYKRYILDQ